MFVYSLKKCGLHLVILSSRNKKKPFFHVYNIKKKVSDIALQMYHNASDHLTINYFFYITIYKKYLILYQFSKGT